MTTERPADEVDLDQFYDGSRPAEFICRVCGALVPRTGDYPRVQWDRHEASNGA